MTILRVGAALAGVVALAGLTGVADAGSVPYTDPAAHGVIGLCDKNGQPVTHGSIHDKPFVWRSVSSVAAPAGYGGPHAKATLLAYQPRPQTPADQWSGDTLTSTSSYTNPAYPMAQATSLDFTLADFLNEYPPMVDGLIQLRMYFASPHSGTLNAAYPATNVKISGDTWTVVDGANLPCANGSAAASETILGSPAPAGSSPATPAGGASSGRTSSHSTPARPAGTTPTAGVTGPGSSTAPQASVSTRAVADRKSSDSGGTAPVVIGIVAALALAGTGGWWWRRRATR